VRLYATDCSGLQNVGGSCKKHGLKLIAGVFIESTGLGPAAEQVAEIVAWGKQGNWANVEMIVIGNECLFNGYVTAGQLAGFISTSKAAFKAAGYGGPCTTTEPVMSLQKNAPALCDSIDVVAANIQPFFDGTTSAADAGSFVADQLKLVGEACPGKDAYNLECGWPSNGQTNGAAVPGPSEQRAAIGSILDSSVASKTVIFAFQNDAWKGPGDHGVEPYFGCADILS
jgi:exo-beta-1,3-glucanase (GH17 family)